MKDTEERVYKMPQKWNKPGEDCIPFLPRSCIICRCRVSGTLALWGLSGYSFYLLKTKKPLKVADKRFYLILGAISGLLGVYRGFFYCHGVFHKQVKKIGTDECNNSPTRSLPSHRAFHEPLRQFPPHSRSSMCRSRTRWRFFYTLQQPIAGSLESPVVLLQILLYASVHRLKAPAGKSHLEQEAPCQSEHTTQYPSLLIRCTLCHLRCTDRK